MERPKVRFVPKEAVLERQENREPMRLVEVLDEELYREAHLPDAINLPLERLRDEAPRTLAKDEFIVVYCRSYTCHASTKAARILRQMGYRNVVDYKGGKDDWAHAGLPLEREHVHEPAEEEAPVAQR